MQKLLILLFASNLALVAQTDPRRIGVRPTGSYWGTSGEQIDLVSGNLNFWMPLSLITVKMRGGTNIPFGLSTSQRGKGAKIGDGTEHWRERRATRGLPDD